MKVLPEERFFVTGSSKEIWERYCSFLDISISEFMDIQNYMLLEQVREVANTPLARWIMKGQKPTSVEEFRRTVPITTYRDYAQILDEKSEQELVEKPFFWCHTAGRGGNFKWIPYTKAAFDRISRYAIAVGILSATKRKGEVKLDLGSKILINLAPRPYASGSLFHYFGEYFPFKPIPALEDAENLDFAERTKIAFRQALNEGIDYIFSTSTVLLKIAESFADQENKQKLPLFKQPKLLARLAKGWLKSKIAQRKMMPRDLWSPKGLVTFGVDTTIHENEIAKQWGVTPYQVYGTTEMMISAVQSWNKRGLTFLPDVAFWESIPQSEWQQCRLDPGYQPKTVLMDQLEAGKQYEVVYTHFNGMPLLRYRIGDIIKVVSLEDTESGVKLPQVAFQSRANEVIDLAGLTQIDKKTLSAAIANSGVTHENWCARKEYQQGLGFLRLFLECRGGIKPEEYEEQLECQLRKLDVDYRDLEGWLGQKNAIRVTLLSPGTFARFYEAKVTEGAPIAQLRPQHINPDENSVSRLLQLSNKAGR